MHPALNRNISITKTYNWNLKNNKNELIFQYRNRLTDTEKEFMLIKRDREGRNKLAV